jgi:hypothetical protein
MNNTFKVLTLCSSVALLLGTAQVAHAHAGFKDQITEGTVGTWNAVKIGHGCATNASGEGVVGTKQKDVIAISALFPNPTDIKDVIFREVIYIYWRKLILFNAPYSISEGSFSLTFITTTNSVL